MYHSPHGRMGEVSQKDSHAEGGKVGREQDLWPILPLMKAHFTGERAQPWEADI